jgi:hypothetical protein
VGFYKRTQVEEQKFRVSTGTFLLCASGFPGLVVCYLIQIKGFSLNSEKAANDNGLSTPKWRSQGSSYIVTALS